LQIPEANALLYGRYEVVPDDLLSVRWGLCTGGCPDEFEQFDRVAKPLIEEANASRAQDIDKLQLQLLTKYETGIPSVPSNASSNDLVDLMRKISGMIKDVQGIHPSLATTDDAKRRLLSKLEKVEDQLNIQIKGVHNV
jgi:hypothetical protein